MPGKIVIIGATGQLGGELLRLYGEHAEGLTREDLDLTKVKLIREQLASLQPAAVINAAAYTAVDRAEEDQQLCRLVNTLAVGQIAAACEDADCPLVHVSTDYVFTTEPKSRMPWQETDSPQPLGEYATSKWRGEQEAERAQRRLVVRTCGLYAGSADARNFVNTMLRFAQAGRPLRVVDDQFCTPSYVPHVAAGIKQLMERAVSDDAEWGTYHLTNRGAATWLDVAQAIMELAGFEVNVEPISTREYGAAAPRPAYSVLDCRKFQTAVGEPLPLWREALAERMRRLT